MRPKGMRWECSVLHSQEHPLVLGMQRASALHSQAHIFLNVFLFLKFNFLFFKFNFFISGATYDHCIVVAETILSHIRVGVKPLCYVHVCDIQCLSCTHLLGLLTSGFMPPKHL